jgi:hypothetical protein
MFGARDLNDLVVALENLGKGFAELLEDPGRAFDVREQEADRP